MRGHSPTLGDYLHQIALWNFVSDTLLPFEARLREWILQATLGTMPGAGEPHDKRSASGVG